MLCIDGIQGWIATLVQPQPFAAEGTRRAIQQGQSNRALVPGGAQQHRTTKSLLGKAAHPRPTLEERGIRLGLQCPPRGFHRFHAADGRQTHTCAAGRHSGYVRAIFTKRNPETPNDYSIPAAPWLAFSSSKQPQTGMCRTSAPASQIVPAWRL